MISLKSIIPVKIKGDVCSKITVFLKHQLYPKVESSNLPTTVLLRQLDCTITLFPPPKRFKP